MEQLPFHPVSTWAQGQYPATFSTNKRVATLSKEMMIYSLHLQGNYGENVVIDCDDQPPEGWQVLIYTGGAAAEC